MRRPITPAQRAAQITWQLKGHLKNVQIAYLRAGALLAEMRDDGLYRALKHPDIESYASERLGLQRASLYRYLQIYDWVRAHHREWLAKHPKGFIPDLSEAHEIIWIEHRLEDTHLGPTTRAELEIMRKKALAGKLTKSEFEEFRRRGRKRVDSITAVAASLRAVRRRLAALPDVSPDIVRAFDDLLDRLKSASGAVAKVVSLAKARRLRLSGYSRAKSTR